MINEGLSRLYHSSLIFVVSRDFVGWISRSLTKFPEIDFEIFEEVSWDTFPKFLKKFRRIHFGISGVSFLGYGRKFLKKKFRGNYEFLKKFQGYIYKFPKKFCRI